jgi:hypothetical protein
LGDAWLTRSVGRLRLVATNFTLSGTMIPRTVKRSIDQRMEERVAASETGVLSFRGRNHVVRLVNTSSGGAMVIFPLIPHIGEKVRLKLLDRGSVPATVRWVRDGRIGVGFEPVPE